MRGAAVSLKLKPPKSNVIINGFLIWTFFLLSPRLIFSLSSDLTKVKSLIFSSLLSSSSALARESGEWRGKSKWKPKISSSPPAAAVSAQNQLKRRNLYGERERERERERGRGLIEWIESIGWWGPSDRRRKSSRILFFFFISYLMGFFLLYCFRDSDSLLSWKRISWHSLKRRRAEERQSKGEGEKSHSKSSPFFSFFLQGESPRKRKC